MERNAKMLPERGTILSSRAYKSGRKLILLSNRISTLVPTLELIRYSKVKENSRTTHSIQAFGTGGSVLSSRALSPAGSALPSRD